MRGTLNPWVISINRFEFMAFKSCHFMVANLIFMKFQNSTFSLIVAALGRSRAQKCSWVLAGANFNALRRRGVMHLRFLALLHLHDAKRSP